MFTLFETIWRNADKLLIGNCDSLGHIRAASLKFIGGSTRDLSELSAEAELIELRALVADLVDVESTISAELIIGVQNGALETLERAALAVHVVVGTAASVCSGRSLARWRDFICLHNGTQLGISGRCGVEGAVLVTVHLFALVTLERTASEVIVADEVVSVIAERLLDAGSREILNEDVAKQVAELSAIPGIAFETFEWAAFAVSSIRRGVLARWAFCAASSLLELRAASRDVRINNVALRGGESSLVLGIGFLSNEWAALSNLVLGVDSGVALGQLAGLRACLGDGSQIGGLVRTKNEAESFLGVLFALFTNRWTDVAIIVDVLVGRSTHKCNLG